MRPKRARNGEVLAAVVLATAMFSGGAHAMQGLPGTSRASAEPVAAGASGAVTKALMASGLTGELDAPPRRGGRFDAPMGPGEHRYIVRTDGTGALDRVAARLGPMSVTAVDRFERVLTALVVQATPERAAALGRMPGVVSVSREVPMRAAAMSPLAPDGISVGAQGSQTFPAGTGFWGLDRVDQRSSSLNNRFDYANAGVGVLVYVVDTGLRVSHEEFKGRVSTGRSYFVPFPGDSSGIGDCSGHGTGMAGVVGGTSAGVAKGVTLAAVKVLDCSGNGSDATVMAGLDHVLASRPAGVPVVVNMSLGGTLSAPLNAAVKAVVDAGITVVVASGNTFSGGEPACNFSPGSTPSAITVGATDRSETEASFSNFGPCVDILAPGVGVRMPYPFASSANQTPSDITFVNRDGTSIAAPFVSGAAALVLQRNPSMTPAQVWSSLQGSATLNAITERTTYGGGTLSLAVRTPDRLLFVEQVAAAPPGVDGMNPFAAPVRFVDTRATTNGTNYRGALEQADEATSMASGEVRRYPMVGVRGIPEDATVMLNVVAVATTSPGTSTGFLTVWPCASTATSRPTVSFLNYSQGRTIANGGMVGIGPEGGLCVFAALRTHLVIDVTGWLPPGDTVTSLSPPLRLLDTRPTLTGTDRRGALESSVDESAPYSAGTVRRYVLSGAGSLPASGMRAVALNVTAVSAGTSSAAGELAVYPCDSPDDAWPPTTTVTYPAGGTVATGTVAVLSTDGGVCVRSTGATHMVLDAAAWLADGAGFDAFAAPSLPVRLLDTRAGVMGSLELVDRTTPLPAQASGGTEFVIDGVGGLPLAGVMGSAALTLTVRSPAANGYVIVWSCASGSTPAPTASVLNFRAGVSISNVVVTAVDNSAGTPGGICVQVSSSVHVSIDVTGWFLRSPP
ncbi:MAG: S8 family peptidase [Ilumatobacteraceae bacterium]